MVSPLLFLTSQHYFWALTYTPYIMPAGLWSRDIHNLVTCVARYKTLPCSAFDDLSSASAVSMSSRAPPPLPTPPTGLLVQGNVFIHRLYHHHHHQSLNPEGRWGTTDDFATSFLHFFPCSPLPSGTCRTQGLFIL